MSQDTIYKCNLHFTARSQNDSYISKLTPSFVRALAVSAFGHQTTYLRDAICRHIAMESSIRVQIPVRISYLSVTSRQTFLRSHIEQTHGWKTFCLEFHLAYLILREVKSSPTSNATEDERESANRPLIDLACLDLQSSSDTVSSRHFILEANISVVVCGWSNTEWTGYAFANTGTKAEEEEEVDEDDPEGEAEDRPQQDFLAAEDGCDYVVDANNPEWDARHYWLRVFAIRCELVWKEWQYLVRTVEDAIEAWVSLILSLEIDLTHQIARNLAIPASIAWENQIWIQGLYENP